jgi:VanZ family protein
LSAIKSNSTSRAANWASVVLWAGLIFWFSTASFGASSTSRVIEPIPTWIMPSISPDQLTSIHFSIRKLGHLSEYFIFAVLLSRALVREFESLSGWRGVVITFLLVSLYAVSDEWHQSFVPGRTASSADVMLDSAGGFCGVMSFTAIRRGRKKLDNIRTNRDHSRNPDS